MGRFGLDAVGAYVLAISLATLLAAILATRLQKSRSAFAGGLAVALIGFLLGCIVPLACMKALGYSVIREEFFFGSIDDAAAAGQPAPPAESESQESSQPPAAQEPETPG